MLKTAITVGVSEQGAGFRGQVKWPMTTSAWMAAGFLIALLMAAVMLALLGIGDRGTEIALRATARWSFLLFWLAYIGSAMASLFGQRFTRLAQHGRDLGLAFASAQLVHVGLVLWLYYHSTGPGSAMLVFWAGIACTYMLALLSWARLRDALGVRAWRILRTAAMEYIAYVFAVDFILIQLHEHGVAGYRPSYVPFAVMLVGGFLLRIMATVHYQLRARWGAVGVGRESSS